MGYRSKIGSVIYGAPVRMAAFLAAARLRNSDALTELSEDLKVEIDSGNMYLFLEGEFKWYPTVPEVRDWEKLLDEAQEVGLDWEFMRSGEDDEDNEHNQSSDRTIFYLTKIIEKDF